MDVSSSFKGAEFQPVSCVDMHTTGMPTRILYSGFPDMKGTLFEQWAEAKLHHDAIRQRVMYEPRGHNDM
jgi:trans-L-3-hydroxyproline dehydratase